MDWLILRVVSDTACNIMRTTYKFGTTGRVCVGPAWLERVGKKPSQCKSRPSYLYGNCVTVSG